MYHYLSHGLTYILIHICIYIYRYIYRYTYLYTYMLFSISNILTADFFIPFPTFLVELIMSKAECDETGVFPFLGGEHGGAMACGKQVSV